MKPGMGARVRAANSADRKSVDGRFADQDGHPIFNEILLALPAAERARIVPQLEFRHHRVHHVLHHPGDTMKSAYFANTGLVSILNTMPDGRSVEVGLVGKEGFIGLPLLAGFHTSATLALAQITGTAFRIQAETLVRLFPACPVLLRGLTEFSQIATMQVTQLATCNRLHEVNERLARWLLMSADRVGSNSLPLTQEFLGNMLGARRSSVTVAAGSLARAGLITYSRGAVEILERGKLEEAACECYDIMQRQVAEWRGGGSAAASRQLKKK